MNANTNFFSFLRDLKTKHDVRLIYIPGNHDRVINTATGMEARRHLLRELPLEHLPDGKFDCQLQDHQHGVLEAIPKPSDAL